MTIRRIHDEQLACDLIIDPDIPGQIGWDALVEMARVARAVPAGGVLVETGSLFGRSSLVWAMNVPATTEVFCIDPWIREPWIVELVESVQPPVMPFSQEAHAFYTQDCPNITRIQGYSPDVVRSTWSRKVDLYFDDSDHTEPGLSQNWGFWLPWVKPGGIVCGDDYGPHCPDVMEKAEAMSRHWSTPLHTVGVFWWLRRGD